MESRARTMSPLRLQILKAVADWPLPSRECAKRLGVVNKDNRIGSEMHYMEKIGLLKICGTAWEAGFVEGYKATTRVYGLPAFPMLPSIDEDETRAALRNRTQRSHHRRPIALRRGSGSGVIAPPPYRTGFRWFGAGL